ncbi:MAG: NUDIX domain-containing protein [Candidatus Nomurabacteria bacterium]|jgi:ADP-ribose pyrophosphatase YjhB (NUDIX family)|nr:NUDIX domain-containing protein [Candidatus Nomurabacteria bacterium]
MSHEAKIHEAQTTILRELLFLPEANFAVLQRSTGLESDHAKFHIKRLVELEYLEKNGSVYSLSIKGKEYANKLDTDTNTIERQPKSTTIMIVKNPRTGKFLIQQRLKNPYFGFWTFYSGKIRWGETIPETAVRETEEETGLITEPENWQWRGVYHEIVRHAATGEIVEDKLFYVMYTDKYSGKLMTDFEGGRNAWMTLDEVRQDPKHFHSFEIEARAATKNIGLVERVDEYSEEF